MKILFCTLLVHDEEEALRKISKKYKCIGNPLTISWEKLTLNIIDGLESALNEPITIINSISVPSFPHFKGLFFKTKEWNRSNSVGSLDIGKINIAIIKYICEIFLYKKYIKKWIKNNKDEKLCVLTCGRYISHVSAINYIKKRFPNITTCTVLGDLSGSKAYKDTVNNGFRKYLIDKLMDLQMNQVLKFDSFVLLTKYMVEALDLGNKPYAIMEGIAHESITKPNIVPNEKIVIFFAGALSEQFGIKRLIEVFVQIQDLDLELWIAGGGDMQEYIRNMSLEHDNIKFFGVLPSQKVIEYQSQATVLINPRTNEGEYTKYSFPSKTMEYMASGKPVIMYKLDGIPDEYDEYLYYVEDNSVDALKNKIIEVCSKSSEELNEFGMKAREWVLREKNSVVQAKKIIDMLCREEG